MSRMIYQFDFFFTVYITFDEDFLKSVTIQRYVRTTVCIMLICKMCLSRVTHTKNYNKSAVKKKHKSSRNIKVKSKS